MIVHTNKDSTMHDKHNRRYVGVHIAIISDAIFLTCKFSGNSTACNSELYFEVVAELHVIHNFKVKPGAAAKIQP